MALVLSRKKNEQILVQATNGEKIVITVTHIDTGKIRLAFDAPRDVIIDRKEVADAKAAKERYQRAASNGEAVG